MFWLTHLLPVILDLLLFQFVACRRGVFDQLRHHSRLKRVEDLASGFEVRHATSKEKPPRPLRSGGFIWWISQVRGLLALLTIRTIRGWQLLFFADDAFRIRKRLSYPTILF